MLHAGVAVRHEPCPGLMLDQFVQVVGEFEAADDQRQHLSNQGGEEWESNPPGSAWRHPPGLKPGRPTRIVSSPEKPRGAITPIP